MGMVGVEPTVFTSRVTDFKSVAFHPASPHALTTTTFMHRLRGYRFEDVRF
jgi:hypothetical protein